MKRSAVHPVPVESITRLIHLIRGQRVMLDSDLARLYGVTTKRLNEQVKRNQARFPEDFGFRLTAAEVSNLRSQIATSSSDYGDRRYAPLVFTEHGAIMLASVLNSRVAVATRPPHKRIGFRADSDQATNARRRSSSRTIAQVSRSQ